MVSLLAAAFGAPMDPGLHQRTATLDGQTLRYTLVVPDRLEGAPVVLALHYAGHGAPHYATGFVQGLVQPGLEGLDALILAPDCPGTDWTTTSQQVLTLLDTVLRELDHAPEHTAVLGYSMGGMGTWYLAAHHADRFDAALPIAGHPRDLVDHVEIPVYAIHGARDELIGHGPTRAAVKTLTARGVDAQLVIIPKLTHYQVPAFAPTLRAAQPWLRRVWASQLPESNAR